MDTVVEFMLLYDFCYLFHRVVFSNNQPSWFSDNDKFIRNIILVANLYPGKAWKWTKSLLRKMDQYFLFCKYVLFWMFFFNKKINLHNINIFKPRLKFLTASFVCLTFSLTFHEISKTYLIGCWIANNPKMQAQNSKQHFWKESWLIVRMGI